MVLDKRLAELRDRIQQLSPAKAHERLVAGAVLIDVRDPGELAQGMPTKARGSTWDLQW